MEPGAAVEKKHMSRRGCLKTNNMKGHLLHKVLVGAGETRKEIEHLHSSSGVSTSAAVVLAGSMHLSLGAMQAIVHVENDGLTETLTGFLLPSAEGGKKMWNFIVHPSSDDACS